MVPKNRVGTWRNGIPGGSGHGGGCMGANVGRGGVGWWPRMCCKMSLLQRRMIPKGRGILE